MRLGEEVRFRMRPMDEDVARLTGKLLRYVGSDGNLRAIGVFRGYMFRTPLAGELAWISINRNQSYPFLVFEGFQIPTAAHYAAEEILQEILEF